MTPDQLKAARLKLGGLSHAEFGNAIGISDAGRTVRAWEKGVRHGEPYKPSGSAIKVISLLLIIHDVLDLLQRDRPLAARDMLRAVVSGGRKS